jgi:predicted RNA-binding protein (virulence factor B family)
MQEIRLGKRNKLEVMREVDFGVYLDGGEIGDILLPKRYVPEGCKPGDIVDIFLYLDNEERLIATTEEALIEVGEFACLEVNWTNQYGAFLNWGLMKDLFCPFSEQRIKMQIGKKYVVYCYIDPKTYRIVASAKIDKFLSNEEAEYEVGETVEALVYQRTDLGYKAIINGRHSGLIFGNATFKDLYIGDRLTAYIKNIRPDGKIDLDIHQHGKQGVDDFADRLLQHIFINGGFSPFHDKTPAEDIYDQFQVSKKTFKKAVGDLYKHKFITIKENGLEITPKGKTKAEAE